MFPDERGFVKNYVDAACLLGLPREAIDVSSAYIEQHPGDSKAWRMVSKSYLAMGLPDSAEAASRRALEIEPDFFSAQLHIIYCDYFRGNVRQAIDGYELLLARSDLLPGARVGLLMSGWFTPSLPLLYAECGRFQKALELFEEARQFVSDPESEISIEHARSRVLLRSGRAEEVLCWARGVPGRSDSFQNVGNAVLAELRALVALDSLEAVSSAQAKVNAAGLAGSRAHLFPDDQSRAEIALAEKAPEAALEILLEMPRFGMSPVGGWLNIEWRETLARAYRMASRLDEAAGVHEEMLRLFGGHSLSHYDLGQIYEEMGRTADAEQEYVAFLEAWAEADDGLPQVEDAKQRLKMLRTRM